MKKGILLLTLFLCIAGNYALAQNCNFDKDEIDAYSKLPYRSVKHTFGNMRKRWLFIMEQKGTNYTVTLNMAEIGDFNRNVARAGTKLMLKMQDNSVVEVSVEADAVPSVQIVAANLNSQWLIKCSITADQMKTLATKQIESMRINMGDRDFDSPDLKGKQSEKIMKSAGCLLQ